MMMPTTREKFSPQHTFALGQDAGPFPAPGLSDVRVLVVDNYDSFTYNLVQYLGEISGTKIKVFRNDDITVEGIRAEQPTHVVVSPGPCTPDDAGISLEVIEKLGERCQSSGSVSATSRSGRRTAAR